MANVATPTLDEIRQESGFKQPVSGEKLGTGDGSNRAFNLDSVPASANGGNLATADVEVYQVLNDVKTDLTVSAIALNKITLSAAPPNNAAIYANYSWTTLEDSYFESKRAEALAVYNRRLEARVYAHSNEPVVLDDDETKLIIRLLAGGLVMINQYSATDPDGELVRNGYAKKAAAMKLLKDCLYDTVSSRVAPDQEASIETGPDYFADSESDLGIT